MGAMLDVSLCCLFGLVIITFWLDLFRLLNLTIILMIRSYNWNYRPFLGQHNQFFTSKTFCYKTHILIFPRLGTSYTNSSNVAVSREPLSCIVTSQLLVLYHQIFIAIGTLSSLTKWYLSKIFLQSKYIKVTWKGFFMTFQCTEDQWEKIFDVNVKSSFLLTKSVVPHLRKRGGGSVVFVASIAGFQPMPVSSYYIRWKAFGRFWPPN